MDTKEFLKRIPTWLIAVVVFVFLLIFIERIYIAKKPVNIFGREFGPVEISGQLPVGTIIAWDSLIRDTNRNFTGKTRTVPKGWLICDGTNGTPDLTNRVLRGVQSTNIAGTDLSLCSQMGDGDLLPLKWVKHKPEDDITLYGVFFLIKVEAL